MSESSVDYIAHFNDLAQELSVTEPTLPPPPEDWCRGGSLSLFILDRRMLTGVQFSCRKCNRLAGSTTAFGLVCVCVCVHHSVAVVLWATPRTLKQKKDSSLQRNLVYWKNKTCHFWTNTVFSSVSLLSLSHFCVRTCSCICKWSCGLSLWFYFCCTQHICVKPSKAIGVRLRPPYVLETSDSDWFIFIWML